MTVTFFSNFFNHHQKPFSDEMFKLLGNDYTFVATETMPNSFSKAGYKKYDEAYLLPSYTNKENYEKAIELGLKSDVVIIGAASLTYIKDRVKENKITFRYAERLFKKSKMQKFNPRAILHQYKNHTSYKNKKVYMLCASAYTANDLNWLRAYPNKMYKWGYFTKTAELDIKQILENKRNKKFSIICVSRLIDWKHIEMAVEIGRLLKEKNYNFEINIVGSGEMKSKLDEMIINYKLNNHIHLLGNVANDDVLTMMQKSHVFFFPSDRNEGWGAVANEAMANGCALVASHEIGAVPYLIEPNKNGLIFKSQNIEDGFKQIEKLLNNPALGEKLALNAYKAITNIWSPKKAAENFIELYNSISKNRNNPIKIGPCSSALSTENNWYIK